jgi:hypothetical protein
MSVCLSTCLLSCLCLYARPAIHTEESDWMDFDEIWYLNIFRKIYLENSSLIKILQE